MYVAPFLQTHYFLARVATMAPAAGCGCGGGVGDCNDDDHDYGNGGDDEHGATPPHARVRRR